MIGALHVIRGNIMSILELLKSIDLWAQLGIVGLLFFSVFVFVLLRKGVTVYQIIITSILLLVVGSISYMSVYGFTAVFEKAFWAVLALGIGMELGKVLLVVNLHKRWNELKWFFGKTAYIIVISVLTLITTTELLGFLAQSHTASSTEVSTLAVKIISLENKERLLTKQLNKYESILDGLPKGYVSLRLNKQKELGYQEKENELLIIQDKLSALKSNVVIERIQAGPIFSAARLANIPDDKTIFWFIMLIVIVVEPFSIGLTVATSRAWMIKVNDPEEEERLANNKKMLDNLNNIMEKSASELTGESVVDAEVEKAVRPTCEFVYDMVGETEDDKILDEIIHESVNLSESEDIKAVQEKEETQVKTNMTLKDEKTVLDTGIKPEKPKWEKKHKLFGKNSFKAKKDNNEQT